MIVKASSDFEQLSWTQHIEPSSDVRRRCVHTGEKLTCS